MQVLLALTVREGRWTIHIHGPHVPGGKQHAHVRARKLRGTYSWNIDGSRHDEHNFPANEMAIETAKRKAATHLGVPEASLSFLTRLAAVRQITVSIEGHVPNRGAGIVLTIVQPDCPVEVILLTGQAGRIHLVVLGSEDDEAYADQADQRHAG